MPSPMSLAEYAKHDALGLADLVARKEVTPKELAAMAARAMTAIDGEVRSVVETYPDRIEGLDAGTLGKGPFHGVPFLMKDVFGHEGGRKIENGSRLCAGMVADIDSHFCTLLKAAGVNILGRSAAPEYSMSGTTESALHGKTSTPWRKGYSAGGSTGGGAAAVAAGIVPIAHGSDIGGSIRIPASYCGGVGLKPSRGRISAGPSMDERGFGLAMNFVQTKTVRDAAAMLDCLAIPQPGDPFHIPHPGRPYATLAREQAPRLRIGFGTAKHMGLDTDPGVRAAVEQTAKVLAGMGHEVEEADPEFGGIEVVKRFADVWFFGFDLQIAGYEKRTGRKAGPDTLEPVILQVYEHAKRLKPADFFAAMGEINATRRRMGKFFQRYDVYLSPTTFRTSEPWGNYNLGRTDVTMANLVEVIFAGTCQYTVPFNIMGTPAISLPLAMHDNGLPIGVQMATGPAREEILLQLATALEQAMPWADRVPPLHVSRAGA
jgi:amidase